MTWRLISSEKASIDAAGVQALGLGELVEGGVVPAGRARRMARTGARRTRPASARAACEGADARGQAVAGGRADHQHALGRAGDGTLLAHVVDLLAHIGLAAGGMGGHADETAHAGLMTRRTPSWAGALSGGDWTMRGLKSGIRRGAGGSEAKMRRALYGSRARGGQLTGCRLARVRAGGGPAARAIPPGRCPCRWRRSRRCPARSAGPGMAPDQPAHGGGADDL